MSFKKKNDRNEQEQNRDDEARTGISRREFIAASAATAAGASLLSAIPSFAEEGSSSDARNQTFEYLVVGAGMIGAATAWYLAQSSSGVAVVGDPEPDDLSTHEGAFSSHYDSSRFYRTLDPQRSWAIASDRSMRRYKDIEKGSGIEFHKPVGNLRVYPPSKALGTYFDIDTMEKVAKASPLD